MDFNGTRYGYVQNLQGDICQIIDANGAVVVEYTYDAWGKVLNVTGSMAGTLGEIQPFRYRGYVYDVETELYYLRSRYYNSNWKRFINADSIIKLNIYAYCNNSAIVCKDETGRSTRYDCADCYRMKPGDNLHYHYKNPQKFETDDYYPAQVTGNQVRIRNVNGERTGRTTDKGGNWYARPKQDKEGEITDEEFAEVLDTQGTEYYATAVSISWRYLSVKTDRFGTAKSKGGRIHVHPRADINSTPYDDFMLNPEESAYIIDEKDGFYLVSCPGIGSGWVSEAYFVENDWLYE